MNNHLSNQKLRDVLQEVLTRSIFMITLSLFTIATLLFLINYGAIKSKGLNNPILYLTILELMLVFITLIATILLGRHYMKKTESIVITPIENLILSMKKIARDNTNVPLEPKYIYEFNQLIDSFNVMLAQKSDYEKKLEYLAYHDTETGIANYHHLVKKLSEIVSSRAPGQEQHIILCHLIFHNLDIIDNIWGKEVCEELIREFFKVVLSSDQRPELCAKIGNNHYAIYFTEQLISNVPERLDTLINRLNNPLRIREVEAKLNFTMGVSYYPDHAESIAILIQNAKFSALQLDKQSEKKYRLFNSKDKDLIIRQSTLEESLPNAIKNKEIHLVYQPQFDLLNNRLIGCEVLARWNHPKYGAISPKEFIPMAERSEQIVILGRLIHEDALEHYAQWIQGRPRPFKLALNASLLEIASPYYHDILLSLVKQRYLDPRQIEIEITESYISQYPSIVKATMVQLKKSGFLIAIDDFGTGYSTLERLKSLDVDLIKIDKVFADGIESGTQAKNLLESIIHIANKMGIPTMIEGVETKEQVDILKTLPCQYAQGFYFGAPLNAKQMQDFLNKHHA